MRVFFIECCNFVLMVLEGYPYVKWKNMNEEVL